MYKWTVHCRACGNTYRMQLVSPTTTAPVQFKYCACCGADATATYDQDLDQYELLAKLYGLPVDLVQALYAMWDWREHHRFGDFVAEFKGMAQGETLTHRD